MPFVSPAKARLDADLFALDLARHLEADTVHYSGWRVYGSQLVGYLRSCYKSGDWSGYTVIDLDPPDEIEEPCEICGYTDSCFCL